MQQQNTGLENKLFLDTNNNKYYVTQDKVLGKGSFGSICEGVYEQANDSTKTQKVAVKIIPYRDLLQAFKEEEKKLKDSFVREIQLMQQTKHQNILRFYNFEQTKNNLYLFVELMDGSFTDILDKFAPQNQAVKVLDFQNIIHYFGQMLDAVSHLQSKQNICHRDIKPDNFLFKKQNKQLDLETLVLQNKLLIKLGDFGTAKQLDTYQSYVSKIIANNEFITNGRGTFVFFPPELITGDYENTKEEIREVQFKQDTWALGAILYRMIYNSYPFNMSKSMTYIKETTAHQGFNQNKLNSTRQIPEKYQFLIDILNKMMQPEFKNRIFLEDLVKQYGNKFNISQS